MKPRFAPGGLVYRVLNRSADGAALFRRTGNAAAGARWGRALTFDERASRVKVHEYERLTKDAYDDSPWTTEELQALA